MSTVFIYVGFDVGDAVWTQMHVSPASQILPISFTSEQNEEPVQLTELEQESPTASLRGVVFSNISSGSRAGCSVDRIIDIESARENSEAQRNVNKINNI